MSPVRPARLRVAAAVVAAVAVTVGGAASAKLVKFGVGSVSLHATGPAGVDIEATTTDVRAADTGTSLAVIAGLAGLTTGDVVLDHAIARTLETTKCPTATLRVPTRALQLPKEGAQTEGEVLGRLRLHCTSADVRFRYSATRAAGMIDVRGALTIDMRDFGMQPPSFLGLRARPEVDVAARFHAKD
jgi:hypothetical protein